MPFLPNEIGLSAHNLFDIRQNLRFSCIIFRHYLEREKSDIVKDISRYNGTYGISRYPFKVLRCYLSRERKFAVFLIENYAVYFYNNFIKRR